MRSLNCTGEQRPHRYHGNKTLVTSMVEEEMKRYPLPHVQLPLPRDTISLLRWVQAWQAESVPWLWQPPRKPAARGSRDDLMVSSWMLGPDLCFTPAHDRLPGTLLVC